MCGRFANHINEMHEWADIFSDWPKGGTVGYNIAPTLMIPVFTCNGSDVMRWGLIPSWADKAAKKYSTYNARLDTAASKPAYRHAWNHAQRCLIPILGYYEWRKEGSTKQPYFIHSVSGSPLAMAGLWEPGREDIPASCTVITMPAAQDIAAIHPRMPVFVDRNRVDEWYREPPGSVLDVVQHWPQVKLEAYKVSTAINNPRAAGEELAAPLC